MLRQQVPAAGLAPLANAARRLAVAADVLGAGGDLHGAGAPQRKGIDGAGRPMAARLAMAIAHRHGLAGDDERNGAAKAAAFVGLLHMSPISANPGFGRAATI